VEEVEKLLGVTSFSLYFIGMRIKTRALTGVREHFHLFECGNCRFEARLWHRSCFSSPPQTTKFRTTGTSRGWEVIPTVKRRGHIRKNLTANAIRQPPQHTGLSLHVQLHKHDHIFNLVRFQVLTAASMKMRVFWDIVPRSLVAADRRFRDAYCLHL
jgi:hypothetical protein